MCLLGIFFKDIVFKKLFFIDLHNSILFIEFIDKILLFRYIFS